MTRNEIDYIITNKPKLFSNIDVVNKFNYNSDHRLLRGQMYIKEPKNLRKKAQYTKHLPLTIPLLDGVLDSLNSHLNSINNIKETQEKYDVLEKELKK